MSLNAIKATAYGAGEVVLNKGSTAANALGRAFAYAGKILTGLAKKVAEWIKVNFPIYTKYASELAKDYGILALKYIQAGMNYIKENKKSFGIGMGAGIGLAALIYTTHHFFFKSTDL